MNNVGQPQDDELGYITFVKQILELNLQLYEFYRHHLIQTLNYRSCTGLQLNLELDGSFRRHSWQIVWKNIHKFSNHGYILHTFCRSVVYRCLDMNNDWEV
jgi:hypothetical protein